MTNFKTKNNARKTTSAANRRTIRGSKIQKTAIPMARASYIPAGDYHTKIVAVNDVVTRAGKPAVEVVYEMADTNGKSYQMREIVPYDSWAFTKFSDAMVAAGVADEADVEDTVGVEEDVELVYDDPHGLGHFATRTPALQGATSGVQKSAEENDDTDGDDFLGDENFLEDDDE